MGPSGRLSWRTAIAGTATVVALAATVVGWQPESDAAGPEAALRREGAALFRAKGCASCHDGPDSSAPFGFPSLADASSWAGERREGLSAEEYLIESIREPQAFIAPNAAAVGPTDQMPALGLKEAEVKAIVAYLLGA